MEQTQDLSTLPPGKRVFAICNANPTASRKEIMAACVAAGVNAGTARKQYYNWKDPETFAAKDKAHAAAYRAANPEKRKAQVAAYGAKSKDKRAAYMAEYYAANKNKIAAYKAAYMAEYYAENHESIAAYRAARLQTPEGRAKAYAHRTKYHASKLNATPAWLTDADREAMQELYAESIFLTQSTGQPYHVDHVLPLKGKIVCGLHVPKNLRVMPGSENISKGNRLTPEDLRMVEAATLADAQRACADFHRVTA